jgi:hypothetical protein
MSELIQGSLIDFDVNTRRYSQNTLLRHYIYATFDKEDQDACKAATKVMSMNCAAFALSFICLTQIVFYVAAISTKYQRQVLRISEHTCVQKRIELTVPLALGWTQRLGCHAQCQRSVAISNG